MEQCFASCRQYEMCNARIGHTSWFDPSSSIPDCPDVTKEELIWNAVFCNHNRNHRFFEEKWPLPTGMTWTTMGQNFYQRIFLQNEFDTYTYYDGVARAINWGVRFKPMPHAGNLGGWQQLPYDDPAVLFGRVAIEDITMLSHGPYQPDNANKYATAMREQEVLSEIRDDEQVTWEHFHTLASALPGDKKVFIYDQLERPDNWSDEDYGIWFARRLLLIEIPSLHKADKHLVVLAYVPDDPAWNDGVPHDFPNRLGFTQEGLRNLVGYACLRDECPIGLRLLGCCSHVATAVMLLGVFQHDPETFSTKHKHLNYLEFACVECKNQDKSQ